MTIELPVEGEACERRPLDAGLSLPRKLGGVRLKFCPTSKRGKKPPSWYLGPGVGESHGGGEVRRGEFDRDEALDFG